MGRNFSKKKPISDRFSSIHFYLAKVYCNTSIHIRIVSWQGSPEETRRPMKPGLPSHKEISKMKFSELSRPDC